MEVIPTAIAPESLSKLWFLLESPYKDIIGSVVREYTSNAWDAHVDAQNDAPVIVSIERDESDLMCFIVQDFGKGMSKEFVELVFSNYLKSTKENTNDAIGCFGIGSKSGLSYTTTVYISSCDGETLTHYVLVKAAPTPQIAVIDSEPCLESGTTIKIILKNQENEYSLEREVAKFRNAALKQLAYFPNVFFKGYLGISNNYVIETNEYAWYRENSIFTELHIIVGVVAYPIAWEVLGITRIQIPVGLKLEIGDVDVIFNREEIQYTDKTIKMLTERIQAFEEHLYDNINSQLGDTDDFLEWLDYDPKEVKYVINPNCSITLQKAFLDQSRLNTLQYTPYSGLSKESLRRLKTTSNYTFGLKAYYAFGKSGRKAPLQFFIAEEQLKRYGKVIIQDTPNDPIRNAYIAGSFNFYRRYSKSFSLFKPSFSVSQFRKQFNIPRELSRQIVGAFIENQKTLLKRKIDKGTFSMYSDERWEPTQSFLDNLKTVKIKRVKVEGMCNFKGYQVVDGLIQTYETVSPYEDFQNCKGLVIYGNLKQRVILEGIANILSCRPQYAKHKSFYKVIQADMPQLEKLKELENPNVKSIDEFFQKDFKLFRTVITALKYQKRIACVLDLYPSKLSELNLSLGNHIDALIDAKDMITQFHSNWVMESGKVDAFVAQCIRVLDFFKVEDKELVMRLTVVERYVDGIEFAVNNCKVEEIAKHITFYNRHVKNPRYFKKMNYQFYQDIKVDELVTTEERISQWKRDVLTIYPNKQ